MRSMVSGMSLPGFRYQIYHLLPVFLGKLPKSPLLICKMETTVASARMVLIKCKCDTTYKTLNDGTTHKVSVQEMPALVIIKK